MSEERQSPDTSKLPPPEELSGDLRPPYGAAAIAGGLVLLLYAITLSRTTAFWDTSEYIATGHIMGVPHQPGNPLFVLLARAWSVLLSVTGLSVAVRINLFSAVMSATAHGLWFLVVHHVLRYFSEDRRFRLIGAAAAVLVSATAFTVWNQSNVNEKVYTVSLLTIALLTWLAFRWQENLGKGQGRPPPHPDGVHPRPVRRQPPDGVPGRARDRALRPLGPPADVCSTGGCTSEGSRPRSSDCRYYLVLADQGRFGSDHQ